MPYKDPEKQKAAMKEITKRQYERKKAKEAELTELQNQVSEDLRNLNINLEKSSWWKPHAKN